MELLARTMADRRPGPVRQDHGITGERNGMSEETGDSDEETCVTKSVNLANRKLGDFEVVRTIGTGELAEAPLNWPGTFARVCLVRDLQTRDYFALKVLPIQRVIQLKQARVRVATRHQVEHVKEERRLLGEVEHPFLVTLLWSSSDRWQEVVTLVTLVTLRAALYLLFPFIPGGEIFSYLRGAGRYPLSIFFSRTVLFLFCV